MKNKLNIDKFLSCIAEPNRLAILQFLKKGEKCACEIHPKLKLPQNLSSHHLKTLKDLGLLKSRRVGTSIIYSRDEKTIKDYLSELNKIF
jgi:ArsR family transcriptional regulator